MKIKVLMVREGHSFLESCDVPKLDGFVVRTSGEVLLVRMNGQRFDGLGMGSFYMFERRDLVFYEILFESDFAALTLHI